MYLALSLHVSALSLFLLLTHAFPIKPLQSLRDLAHQKWTSYSIVDIDGSSLPLLFATTTPILRTVTRTIDGTKTLTVLPSTLISSKETITIAQGVPQPAAPTPIISISTITSISTLRITTVEFKTSISTVTQPAVTAIRLSLSYDEVNPAEENTVLPEEVSFRQSPTLSVASNAETARATTTNQLSSSRASITSSQASTPTPTIHSSQPSISSASFGTRPWNNSYHYLNYGSSKARIPCNTAARTATANSPKIVTP